MCGILGIFNSTISDSELRRKLIECSLRMRHRGPDWSGYFVKDGTGIAHERLAIIDPESGAQPLYNKNQSVVVAANGEIYNCRELYKALHKPYTPATESDCEVLIPMSEENEIAVVAAKLRGMFAFIVFNRDNNSLIAVRDHIGIIPLYIGYGEDGSVWISSELKALAKDCVNFKTFPPGHYYSSVQGGLVQWYFPLWREPAHRNYHACNLGKLRAAFESSVQRHMMSDVPWGVLLSGGLDSSLVASVASRILKKAQRESAQRATQDTSSALQHTAWFPQLHSFCVGLVGSPDILAAERVASFLGTEHHACTYTIQEGLDALREVIYHLETFDTTTVRAATPMFLMSRKIKAMGIKMVLSGEGADEIFAGYLYFHKAPSAAELQAELLEKLDRLHLYDCLRANKATSAWGVEARVPFLDSDFLDEAMSIDPEEKMIRPEHGRIEKHILRQAFDTPDEPFLPADILWRQKEQFSDGVGYGWIDALRDYAAENVTEHMFLSAAHRFPENTPATKEAYFYRAIFEEHFPQASAVRTVPGGPSIACSTERAMGWDASFQDRADCSGRSVAGVHSSAYCADFTV